VPTNANPLVSRFAPCVGLVILRQTFVRRCHSGNCRCRGLKNEQWHCEQLILGSGQMGNVHLSPDAVQLRFARVPSAAVLRPAIAARIPAGSYFDDEHHSARYDRGFFGAKRAATLGLRRLAGGAR
jgi:hypothetical protein